MFGYQGILLLSAVIIVIDAIYHLVVRPTARTIWRHPPIAAVSSALGVLAEAMTDKLIGVVAFGLILGVACVLMFNRNRPDSQFPADKSKER